MLLWSSGSLVVCSGSWSEIFGWLLCISGCVCGGDSHVGSCNVYM